jgi:Uma2 family endonuclease
MSATITPPLKPITIHYPDDDGLPMSDNSWQFNYILLLHANLDVQYRDATNVFVAGNHLIYPVEGDNKIRQAPDVYVAFGAAKKERGSYKVWEEGGVFPQVVFEVWSPHNRWQEMEDKRDFYQKYGAEEYYIIYPEFPSHAEGWRREGETFVRIADMNGHVSPRLGVRFALGTGELTIIGADGRPFRSPAELVEERNAAERAKAEAERAAAEAERAAAEAERVAAEAKREAEEAERAKAAANAKAESAEQRAAKLAEKLRELGINPDTV